MKENYYKITKESLLELAKKIYKEGFEGYLDLADANCESMVHDFLQNKELTVSGLKMQEGRGQSNGIWGVDSSTNAPAEISRYASRVGEAWRELTRDEMVFAANVYGSMPQSNYVDPVRFDSWNNGSSVTSNNEGIRITGAGTPTIDWTTHTLMTDVPILRPDVTLRNDNL